MNLQPCPLCRTNLTIDYDNSTDNYITTYCQNKECMCNNLCSYTAKFINQQLNYEFFIIQDIVMERLHREGTTRLSRAHERYLVSDTILVNKILAPNYEKIKLYLLFS